MADVSSEIGEAPYVSLATFKRSGDAVRTPVWIAPSGGAHFVRRPVGLAKPMVSM